MPIPEDVQFGGFALRRRWIGQKQFHQVVRRIERDEKAGRRSTAGAVMAEMGLLSPRREAEALRTLDLGVAECARCGSSQYRVRKTAGSTRACSACGAGLGEPAPSPPAEPAPAPEPTQETTPAPPLKRRAWPKALAAVASAIIAISALAALVAYFWLGRD